MSLQKSGNEEKISHVQVVCVVRAHSYYLYCFKRSVNLETFLWKLAEISEMAV